MNSILSQHALRHVKNQRRFSSYVLDGYRGGSSGGNNWQWPLTKTNSIFNIVPQGHKYVVERFGKLHSIQDSGWFVAIPFVDKISYVIDIRERAMDIPPQMAITRDNVSVEVSGNLFVKFQDPQNAAYGALNPLYSVTQVRDWPLILTKKTTAVIAFCEHKLPHSTQFYPFCIFSCTNF
jgi:SPFH domain / Band 7 family